MAAKSSRLILILVVVVALAAAAWVLLPRFLDVRPKDQPEPSAKARSQQDAEPLHLEEMQADAIEEQPARIMDRSMAAPPPPSVPKLVVPMSEISFERNGQDLEVRDATTQVSVAYAIPDDDVAKAMKTVGEVMARRARSLIPGCWFHGEGSFPHHLHSNFTTTATTTTGSGSFTCASPKPGAAGQGTTVWVKCANHAVELRFDLATATDAKDLRELLPTLELLPAGRAWLRSGQSPAVVLQLELGSASALQAVACAQLADGRECCALEPWPNVEP